MAFVLNEITQTALLTEIRAVVARILPAWNFDDPNDIGRFLVDLGAAIAERNNYYANTLASESFIQTARDPYRVSLLASLLNYRMATAQPVRALVSFELSAVHTSDITIPAYALKLKTTETTKTSKYFENEELLFIPAGTTLVSSAIFIEGETKSSQFAVDGLDFQTYSIADLSIIVDELPGTLSDYGVHVNTTGYSEWEVVNTFVWSDSSAKVFILRPNLDGGLDIQFGDGSNGVKPAQGGTITATYRVGGGAEVVEAGRISKFVSITSGILPVTITLKDILNAAASYGGSDAETIEQVRLAAPVIGNYEIAMMKADQLEYFCERLAGVARARVTIAGVAIQAAIVPVGGGQPSADLLTTVTDALLNPPRLAIGYSLSAIAPTYKELDLDISVYAIEDSDAVTIDALVRNALNNRLDALTVDASGQYINEFGSELKRADIGVVLKGIDEIYDFVITTPAADVSLSAQNVLTSSHTKPTLTVTGHGSGVDFEFESPTVKIFNQLVRIQFTAASGSVISSTLTDNSSAGTPALDYLVNPGVGVSTPAEITAFINSDPNLILADGDTLADGTDIIGDTKILIVAISADLTDDDTFTYAQTFLVSTSVTNFDVIVNIDT